MFIDTRSLAANSCIRADVCIVGSGPAGISIALELARAGHSVCLLESGGYQHDDRTSRLNDGRSVGAPYAFGEGSRSRFLGGSSNCWGGFCRPWDQSAFETRDWIDHSGWPFGRRELEPYYQRASRLLGLAEFDYRFEHWASRAASAVSRNGRPWTVETGTVGGLPLEPDQVEQIATQFSEPTRFGEVYRSPLTRSERVRVYLHANVIEIRCDPFGTRVEALRVKTFEGREYRFEARQFVLATGGIENARLLLASRHSHDARVGNAHDLVGRFFQDHLRIFGGRVEFAPGFRMNPLFDIKFHIIADDVRVDGQRICAQLRLPYAVQERLRLLDAQVWFRSLYAGERTEVPRALYRLSQRAAGLRSTWHGLQGDLAPLARHPLYTAAYAAAHVTRSRKLVRSVTMELILEPEPNRDSRVMLDTSIDALGMPRIVADWKLTPAMARTVDRTFDLIGSHLEDRGIARITPHVPVVDQGWPSGIEGTYHHMGTTRMHRSPSRGVVDSDCRVHGIGNLSVAGSSVFPTSSSNHPTMTLLALALRLAERLAKDLRTTQTRFVAPGATDDTVAQPQRATSIG